MTPDIETIRTAYIAWVRAAVVPGSGLIVLIAAEQLAMRADFWGAPGGADALRYLFWAVAAAGVFLGRTLKQRGPAAGAADALAATRSLSWKLLALSIAPAPVGFVLSLMTRGPLDFFAMLLVSLAAFAMLFPAYRQWLDWIVPAPPADESDPA